MIEQRLRPRADEVHTLLDGQPVPRSALRSLFAGGYPKRSVLLSLIAALNISIAELRQVTDADQVIARLWNAQMGQRVDQARRAIELSWTRVCDQIGTGSTGSRWVSGALAPNPETIKPLLAIVGLTPDDLLDEQTLSAPTGSRTALAERLLAERARRGWTQSTLCAQLKVSQPTYALWELGVSAPTNPDVVDRLERSLDLPHGTLHALLPQRVYEPDVDPQTLPDTARLLLTRRRQLGWTRAQAAEQLQVSQAMWVSWELGHTRPMLSALPNLRALGLDDSQLLGLVVTAAGDPAASTAGSYLRARRQLAGLSREALSAASGVHRRHIQDVEDGYAPLRHDDLAAICQVLRIAPDQVPDGPTVPVERPGRVLLDADLIRERMKQRGLTVAAVAAHLGRAPSTVKSWIYTVAQVSEQDAQQLQALLGPLIKEN